MLYEVRKTTRQPKRGPETECYALYADDQYVTSIDIPPWANMEWYRIAAKRVRANLASRHDDPSPEFGAAPESEARTFAEMLAYA